MKQNNSENKSGTRLIAAALIALFLAVMSAAVAGAVIVGEGQLSFPDGVAVDGSGNIYVADTGNDTVKKFAPDGSLLPLTLGSSFNLPSGVAVDGTGNIYVADTFNDTVKKFDPEGNLLPLALDTPLLFPEGIAVDNNFNIYVADTDNDRVLKFNSAGTRQLTISLPPQTRPSGVAADSAGNIYVAERRNDLVNKYNSTGSLQLSISNNFNNPSGVAVDTQGNIHVADRDNHRIVKFDQAGNFVSEFGTQGALDGQFTFPHGIAVGGTGIIYVADTNNNRVQVFGGSGSITGTVKNELDSTPIVGASVSFLNTINITDAGGNYTLTNIAAGNNVVIASKAGFVTASATVTVVIGATVTRDFLLTPIGNGTIDGHITNVLQEPLADVSITVGNATNPSIMTLTTGAAGMFNINIAAGNYNVTASKPGFVTTTEPVTVFPGAVSILHITMPHVPVLTGVTVVPAAASVQIGGTQALIASPVDQLGIEFAGATIAWSSSNPAVATVDTNGLVTAVTTGSTTIMATATSGATTVNGTSAITVIPVPTAGNGGSSGSISSGGGGGGGGGGGTSGESFANIEVKESHDEMIYKDKETEYKFKDERSVVRSLKVTGNINAGLINAFVETLKGKSTLVKEAPPGTAYKNFNIFVGTSGFAVPKNIKEARIVVRIEKSWLTANNLEGEDMKVVKWDGTKWNELETRHDMPDDEKYHYSEAVTNTFSSFVVVGIKAPGGPVAGEPPAMAVPVPTQAPPPAGTPKETPGFGLVAAFAALSALYALWRKRR